MNRLVIGTRTSQLALWQTRHVISLLQANWPDLECAEMPIVTRGDRTLDKAFPEIGGKGLFTLELENALRRGNIDLAVHSLKDLPVDQPEGLTLGAIVGRADVRDVLIAKNGWTLAQLPAGARIGTSSLRRQAQLLALRPDLCVCFIRGNVETRIRKVLESEEYEGAILAAAGVIRLGLESAITQMLTLDDMLPAPGQGALGLQCRADDARTLRLLAALDCPEVRACTTTERAFLGALGGGCTTPVAAFAQYDEGTIHLRASVFADDGSGRVKVAGVGVHAAELGAKLAMDALAQGADRLLTPLKGKRILVTRSRGQADDFAERLVAQGAEALLFPLD